LLSKLDGRLDRVGDGRGGKFVRQALLCQVINPPPPSERAVLHGLQRKFQASGHHLAAAMRDVALSDAFRLASPPE